MKPESADEIGCPTSRFWDVGFSQPHTSSIFNWSISKKLRVGYDRALYKQRNLIERCFNRLKQFRRFSTRYCRNIEAFRSCTALACPWIRLQLYVDTA
jgi:transposase